MKTTRDALECLKGGRSGEARLEVPASPSTNMRKWERTAIFETGRLWNGYIGDTMATKDHGENLGTEDTEGQRRCHSKGSVSPRATIRQLEGTDAILEREAF